MKFTILIILIIFQILPSHSHIELALFKKKLPSSKIKVVCEYNKAAGDETGILYLGYDDKQGIENIFLILRGIIPSTCLDLERKAIKLKNKNKYLILSGSNGNKDPLQNQISWTWLSLRSKKECVSYFEHECH